MTTIKDEMNFLSLSKSLKMTFLTVLDGFRGEMAKKSKNDDFCEKWPKNAKKTGFFPIFRLKLVKMNFFFDLKI